MEYNKNRFQKTNDKKILHKVKKQWVVLSVALLAALGGGATVATTHASANADGANGQNNDQETTVKNRINQNLKLAQNQSANNNASQGQTKQVNVNSLSSDQITKQANMLHNQMLLGAAQGTNTKTANGRQAARQNAETNRINANTSAVASAANQKPAANANHSRMFGAAAPAANFGGMRKPEMRLGAMHDFGEPAPDNSQEQALFSKFQTIASAVRNNKNADSSAYKDLMNIADGLSKYKSDQPVSTWQNDVNNAVSDLKTIDGNGDNRDLHNIYTDATNAQKAFNDNVGTVSSLHHGSFNLSDVASGLNLVAVGDSNYTKYANDLTQANKIFNDPDKAAAYHNIVNNVVRNLPNESEQQAKKDVNNIANDANYLNNAANSNNVSKAANDLHKLENNSDVKNPTSAFNVNNLKSLVNKDVRSGYNPSDTQAASSAYQDLMSLASNEASSIANGKKLGSDTTSAGSQTMIQDLNRAKNDLDTLNRNAKVNSDYSLNSLDSEVDTVANDFENDQSLESVASNLLGLSASNSYNYSDVAKSLSGKGHAANKAIAATKAMQAIENNPSQRKNYNNIVSAAAQLPNDNSDVKNSATVNDNKRADVSGLNAEYRDYSNISKNMNSLASHFTGSQDGANNVSADSSSVSAIHNYLTSNAQTASSLAKSASAKASGINAQLGAEEQGTTRDIVPIHIVYENANGSEQTTYDQMNSQYISNSDIDYVTLQGNHNSVANFTIASAANANSVSSSAALGTASNNSGVELYTSGSQATGSVLGSDANYSLYAINNSTGTQSLNAYINQDGTWTWGNSSTASNSNVDQSMPTIVFRAKSGAGQDINIQYINQNGYKVSAEANNEDNTFTSTGSNGASLALSSVASNTSNYFVRTSLMGSGVIKYVKGSNGAYTLLSGSSAGLSGSSYSDDVNYAGADSYGDTINVLNGLDSVSAMSNGSMVYYPATSLVASTISVSTGSGHSKSSIAVSGVYSYYAYGLQSNESAASSFSDYTYGSAEQTVTLPIHGQNVPANYQKVTINTAVQNHKGSFISSGDGEPSAEDPVASQYTVSDLASKAGMTGPVHYGDLIKVDPASYAPEADDVANSSDYQIDPFATASDRSQQNVPYIYISQSGPKWISLQNRSDARPTSLVDNGKARQTSGEPFGVSGKPYADTESKPDTITFNYKHGASIGTVAPIHVTYKDQHGNVVSQGLITPKTSDYGDLIDIPKGSDITNSSNNAMIESGATLPAGYSLDYNKDGSAFDNYQINSDFNASGYDKYTNIGTSSQSSSNVTFGNDGTKADDTEFDKTKNSYVGQDITIYVRGNFVTSKNQLSVNVKHTDVNGNTSYVGKIPINITGFNGETTTLTASDVQGQAEHGSDYSPTVSKPIASNDTLTPSDQVYTVKFANDKVYLLNNKGKDIDANPQGDDSNSAIFNYRDPNSNVNTHNVHIRYFYSDASDIPNSKTPRAKNGLIPLNGTNVSDMVSTSYIGPDSYIKNPPAGYQFVRVINDSDTRNGVASGTNIDNLNAASGNLNLNTTKTSDTIDIQVIPTAGSITFHYYNQNGNPVKPDSDGQIVGETNGVDFTNGGYGYNGNHKSDNPNTSANNTHTEFGNTPTQYLNDGGTYYSRYGQYFNVSDIPVPTGYHISEDYAQGHNRYYRFNRTHQDVDVMVTGNQDDVANKPSDPTNPTTTPGDKGNPINKSGAPTDNNANTTPHYNADTIWVTVHEMDPDNHQIRKYDIPEYISGNTGDKSHLYASDYTPEAVMNQQGKKEYYFTPYQSNQVHDSDTNISGNDNYTQGNVTINSDGTVTAVSDNNNYNNNNYNNIINKVVNGGNQNNHFDFYYYIKDYNNDLYPINVTYMDGSKAVGFKQINPTSDNYYAQDIKNVINYRNGNTTGDTPSDQTNIPSGYKLVNSDDTPYIKNSDANVYSTTFDDNHPQDIVIPVHREQVPVTSNTSYTVIDNFYDKLSNGYTSLVGNSVVSTSSISPAYSGSSYAVTPTSDATYSNVNYTGSENSTAQVLVTSDGATPAVINYNYYSSVASMSAKSNSGNSTGSAVSGTIQPIYVQYFTGSDVNHPNAKNDYMIGSDTELTGQSGSSYANVTNVVPVPAGYYMDPSNQQVTSPAFNDQVHQMDIHVAKDNTSDANFPITIILKDSKGSDIDKYTTNQRIKNHSKFAIDQGNYNPDSKYFKHLTNNSDSRNNVNSNTTVSDANGDLSPITQATLVYQLNTTQPSDLGPINVTYIDEDTGKQVNASNVGTNKINTLKGNYFNQDVSDISKNGSNQSTVPTNYSLVPHQKLNNYHFNHQTQNFDLLVKNNKDVNPSNRTSLKVNVIEVDKDNGTVHYVSDVYNNRITSDTTVDPHNFIPTTDEFNPTYDGNFSDKADSGMNVNPNPNDHTHYTADPSSTRYYVDPADHTQLVRMNGKDKTVTFIYDKMHQHNFAGDIVLKYINEDTGKQVGYTDVIQGKGTDASGDKFDRAGQQINVNHYQGNGNNNDSHGEDTPKGYTLTPSDQRVNYTFNNDEQDVDLFVKGQPQKVEMNIYIHKETQSDPSGDNPKDVSYITTPVTTPAGSRISFEPNNYVPAGFHTDPRYNNPQSVTVNSDGTVNGNVNFYYKQDSITYAKPYIVRYVNQKGQQVGYTDVVNDPDIVKYGQAASDINLTDPTKGGEAVPTGYQLETGKDGKVYPYSSNNENIYQPYKNYSDHTAYNYKFGNNHVITLKVTGKPVKVPLTVHLVELSNDNKPNDATHVYANTSEITKDSDGKGGFKDIQVGDSFILNASQYLDHQNAQDPSDSSKYGYYLPNNYGGSDYNVASDSPADEKQGIDNTAKRVVVMVDKNGNPYLSIDDADNGDTNNGATPQGVNYNDNQAVFYYKPSQNEQAAPINVFYYNQSDGKVLYKGYINPSDVTNNPPAGNGYQLSDVYNRGNASHNQVPSDVSQYYTRVDTKDPATFMHNPQNVYVPMKPQKAQGVTFQVKATVMTPSDKPGKSTMIPVTVSDVAIGDNKTFSPYDYISQTEHNTGFGNLYPSVSDGNYTVKDIQPNQTYTIPFDYQYDTNAATNNLGTINVHYVTVKPNNGEDTQVSVKGTDGQTNTYYQVDQESDHGFDGTSFNLSDYLNDIPSFKNNYYYLVSDYQGTKDGVLGITGISSTGASDKAKQSDLPTSDGKFNPAGFQFHIESTPTPTSANTHMIYGNQTFVSRASNNSTDPNYQKALNTQDIYVVVSPDSINDHGYVPSRNPANSGNDDHANGDNVTNPSYNGALPLNQADDNNGEQNPSYTNYNALNQSH